MSNKIIALVGESGSGKSTIAEKLEKCGLRSVTSFTTRKERYAGETGHIFTTKKQYECNKANGSIAAETLFDGNYYWTTKGQLKQDCVYVIDPVGVRYLKERIKDAEIIVIYLKVDEAVRYKRIVKSRGSESLKRIEHDKEVFKIVETDFIVDANRDIEKVLEDIKFIIGLD